MTKQYDSYRYSGVECLGEIPSHWSVKKIKNNFKIKSGQLADKDNSEKAIYNIYGANGVIGKSKKANNLKKIITIGRVGSCGAINIAEPNSFISDNALFLDFNENKYNFKYVYYYFLYLNLDNLVSKVAMPLLTAGKIKEQLYFSINTNEQTAIANYLDEKISSIEKSIETLKSQKERLIEQKKAIIHNAVTKGLDDSVEMKDSGVDWIGEVPSNWKVVRGKDLLSYKKEKNIGMKESNLLSLTLSGVINRNLEDNNGLKPDSYETYQIVKKNNLIFKLIDLGNKKTSRVGLIHQDGIMSSAYIYLEAKKINSKYAYYYYYDMYQRYIFNDLGGNGVRSALTFGDLLNLKIINPTNGIEIVNYIDKKISKIEEVVNEVEKQINLLEEYKKTLINDVVTGKIKVF